MRLSHGWSVLALSLFACGGTTEAPPARGAPDSGGVATGPDGSVTPGDDSGFGTGTKGLDALPCAKDGVGLATFKSGDGAGGRYVVPKDDNPYTCWVFDSGDKDTHVTDWAPILDNTSVVHHIVMFKGIPGTTVPFGGATGPIDCKHTMPLAMFAFGWAPGGKNYQFPADVEQPIAAHSKMVMQIHYNNNRTTDQTDASGIALCGAAAARPKRAGVLLVGSGAIDLPPHSTNTEVVGHCPPPSWASAGVDSIPMDLDVLGVFPHMHTHGTKIWTDLMRADAQIDKLGEDLSWSFNNQGFRAFDAAKHIKKGDKLVTHCMYDNAGDTAVHWGENTEQEMCFNFMYTVPDLGEVAGDARANMCVEKL